MVAQTTPLAAIVTKFGGGLPAGMLLDDGGAYNVVSGSRHQVWRQDPCWDAVGRWLRRQRLLRPWSFNYGASSLRECCRPTAAKTTPSVVLAIKFGGGFPSGMLLADGGADDALISPDHQVWQLAP